MNHEIVGPEMKVMTGQLRLPKGEALARHVSQYQTRSMGMGSMWSEAEIKRSTEEITTAKKVGHNLKALEFTDRDFAARQIISKNLEDLGIPNALADNWIARDQILSFRKLKKEAQAKDINISIPFLENRDLKTLESEME